MSCRAVKWQISGLGPDGQSFMNTAIVDAVEPSEEFIKIGKKYVGDDDRISFTKGLQNIRV